MIQLPVVFYVRVSSDKQKEAHTVEGQIEALRAFCQREGINAADTYRDEGFSGDLPFLQRPDGARLLADAKSGKFATVLVYLYDRLSRDTYEGLAAAKMLKESGVVPYSIMEPFDITSPHGQYMFINSLNNAQLWKAQFLERTKAGSRRKAREGAWLGGNVPYGYRVEDGRLVPADSVEVAPGMGKTEADIVRWMFAEAAAGRGTTYNLAERLNLQGVPTHLGQTRRKHRIDPAMAGKWRQATIHRILKNTVYKGLFRYGKSSAKAEIIEVACPSLVSPAVWEAVQLRLTRNRDLSRRESDAQYLLRGLIRCENCGHKYRGRMRNRELADRTGNAKGVYYSCSSLLAGNLAGESDPVRCPSVAVSGRLENTVWEDLVRFLRNPVAVAQAVAERAAQASVETEDLAGEQERVQGLLAAQQTERDAILTLFRKGRIGMEALDTQLDAIDREEKALREEERRLAARIAQAESTGGIADSIQAVLSTLAAKIARSGEDPARLPWEERRLIVERLVQEIRILTVVPTEPGEKKQSLVSITYQFGDFTHGGPVDGIADAPQIELTKAPKPKKKK